MDVENAALNTPRMNSYTWVMQAGFRQYAHTRPVIHIRLESDCIEQYMNFRTRVWKDGAAASGVIVPIQQAAIRDRIIITLFLFNAQRHAQINSTVGEIF